jgi:RimJ/RimL family protein N-acetyltransferase
VQPRSGQHQLTEEDQSLDRIEIQTSRLTVRSLRSTDVADLSAGLITSIAGIMSRDTPATKMGYAQVARSWLSSMDEGADLYFVIRLSVNESCLGMAFIRGVRTPFAELGIYLPEEVHGRGFGKEALRGVTTWASNSLENRYVEFPVDEMDVRGVKIAESLRGSIVGHRASSKCSTVVYRLPLFRNAVETALSDVFLEQ